MCPSSTSPTAPSQCGCQGAQQPELSLLSFSPSAQSFFAEAPENVGENESEEQQAITKTNQFLLSLQLQLPHANQILCDLNQPSKGDMYQALEGNGKTPFTSVCTFV